MNHPLCCLAAVLLTASLSGARDELDHMRGYRALNRQPLPYANTNLVIDANYSTAFATAKWVKWDETSHSEVVLATSVLPFHRCGGVAVLPTSGSNPDESHVIVSGLEYTAWNPVSRRGKYLKLTLSAAGTPPSYSITQSGVVALPGIDPYAICSTVEDQISGNMRIYILDRRKRELLAAAWGGWTADLPAGSSFEAVANTTSLPALASFWGDNAITRGGVEMTGAATGDTARLLCLDDVSVEWRITPKAVTSVNRVVDFCVRSPAGASNQEPVRLFCKSSLHARTWRIERVVDGVSVASGDVTNDEWMHLGPTTEPFTALPGYAHDVEVVGENGRMLDAVRIYPSLRYGTDVSSANIRIGRPRMPPRCTLGDANYGHEVYWATTYAKPTSVTVTLWTAFRLPGGSDPVTVHGNVAVLRPEFSRSYTADTSIYESAVGLSVPIPKDQSLDGAVILWQYVMTDARGDLAFSQVFGTAITAGNPDALGSQPASSRKEIDRRLRRTRAPTESDRAAALAVAERTGSFGPKAGKADAKLRELMLREARGR